MTNAVERLQFDEVASQPIESNWNFLVLERMDPARVPPPPSPLTELPSPLAADLVYWLPRLNAPALQGLFSEMQKRAAEFLANQSQELPVFEQAHHQLLTEIEQLADVRARQQIVQETLNGLRDRFGASADERYLDTLRELVKAVLLASDP